MIIDHESKTVKIRQSWLDTFFRCPERGRQQIIDPDADKLTSDSALIGTAMHAAAEQTLLGIAWEGRAEPMTAGEAIDYEIDVEFVKNGNIKWTKYNSKAELAANAFRCYEAWAGAILPKVRSDIDETCGIEQNFMTPVFNMGGYTFYITGTIDLVIPKLQTMWDWKTSARKFNLRDKQTKAIQPTIYTLAAHLGALDDNHWEYPIDFHYGIAVRGVKKSTPQHLTVRRHEGHADFAIRRMEAAAKLLLDYGLDTEWPTNEDHFLCNRTWCPWYQKCKGKHITSEMDAV